MKKQNLILLGIFIALLAAFILLLVSNSQNEDIAWIETHKEGYINKTGQFVIAPEFSIADYFSNGVAAVKVGNIFGYIDSTGKQFFSLNPDLKVSPDSPVPFDPRYVFKEGFRDVVAKNGKYGFIDKSGCIQIEPKYDWAQEFSEGLAAVKIAGKWGFINQKGQVVIPPKFEDWPISFSEGFAVIEAGGKAGYIDKTGTIVIPAQYENAYSFSEGLAAVQLQGKWGYINKSGELIIEARFDSWHGYFSEGLAFVSIEEKWQVIDKQGNSVFHLPSGYSICRDSGFSEGLSVLEHDSGTYGFVNKKGGIVISPCFERAYSFSEGLAAVKLDGKWGFIDKNGKFIISPRFEHANSFSEGLASVTIKVLYPKEK